MEKILCVLAGYDDKTDQTLGAFQELLYGQGFVGTHTRDIPQHITLGIYSVAEESHLIELVTRVAQETRPFDVTFNHIGVFGGSKVLFVAPDPNRSLFRLKENFGALHGWTPHTTMLIDAPEQIYAALPVLAGSFSAFQGTVQSIHLYEFWPSRPILSMTFADGQ